MGFAMKESLKSCKSISQDMACATCCHLIAPTILLVVRYQNKTGVEEIRRERSFCERRPLAFSIQKKYRRIQGVPRQDNIVVPNGAVRELRSCCNLFAHAGIKSLQRVLRVGGSKVQKLRDVLKMNGAKVRRRDKIKVKILVDRMSAQSNPQRKPRTVQSQNVAVFRDGDRKVNRLKFPENAVQAEDGNRAGSGVRGEINDSTR